MTRFLRQLAAPLALACLAATPTPSAAAECMSARQLMPQLQREAYEIVAWGVLGSRKQTFILANPERRFIVLRVTLPEPAETPPAPGSQPTDMSERNEVCIIWRGRNWMSRMILPQGGVGL